MLNHPTNKEDPKKLANTD